MKKVLIVLLASFLLFSCSVDQITNVMGKMGQNVMGDYVNTQAVDTAKSNATSAKSTPVNPNPSGKTVLNSITGKGGTAIAVDLGSAGENVSSMLSGLDKDTKDAILDATSSEGGAKNLSESLNSTKIEDGETKEAAKGTATVLSAVLGKMNNSLEGETQAAVKTLTDKLDKIKNDEAKVSAADVIALQAVTSLVTELASNATVGADGNIDVDMANADTTKLITSSLETVTIIQAVNPANVISSDDLETLIKSLTKSDDSTRSFTVDNKSAEAIRNLYSLYTKLFKDGISASKVSVMSLYSGSVDMYVGFANNSTSKLSGEIVDLDRVVQYVVSAFFSTAEHSYEELAAEVFDGDNYPESLKEFIDKLVENNKWIKDPKLEVEDLKFDFVKTQSNKDSKDIINGILKKMESTGYTLKALCMELKLDKLGIEENKIKQIPDFFRIGIDYEWN